MIAICFFGMILTACSTRPVQDPAAGQNIREITLTSGGDVAYTTGNGRNYSVTFHRDGTAESRTETTEKFVKQKTIVKQARFSTDRFEDLSATIDNNGFFEKNEKDGVVQDAWENLKVVTTDGEKTIHAFGRNDAQVQIMVDAVKKLDRDLQWEEMK
jgi:hypothetical protein